MANLVTFQNPTLEHPEDGNDLDRQWTGYSDTAAELAYEILYLLQNP